MSYETLVLDHFDDIAENFFNSKIFFEYQKNLLKVEDVVIGIRSKSDYKILAYIPLFEKDGVWRNPVTGAFGGIVVREGISVKILEQFIEDLPKVLNKISTNKSISLKLPPTCYPDESPIIANILYRNNWKIFQFDINHHLNIENNINFKENLGHTKQKFIKRLEKNGIVFQQADLKMLEQIYRIIKKNREAQGYPMTMSFESVDALAQKFPEKIKLFAVSLDSQFVASSISIQINKEYLYVFYWGELPEYRQKSPILYLANGMVDYCQRTGIKILDIGSSSLNSNLNYGLCDFKSSIGCNVSHKLTFSLG